MTVALAIASPGANRQNGRRDALISPTPKREMVRMKTFLKVAVLGTALTGLSACEQFGNPIDIIGGNRAAPDEFQVLARAPLRMPAARALPEPRLGEPSPLEPDAQAAAVTALLGPDAAAGAAGGPSAGEEALLAAANASANQSEIRVQIAEENVRLEDEKPYEPPTIFELFSGRADPALEDAIDPAAESRRLQAAGQPAPVDPDDVPEPERARAPSADSDYPATERRPQNKLPSAPTETGF